MSRHSALVEFYPSREAADAAVQQLRNEGFDMRTLSITGGVAGSGKRMLGYYDTGVRGRLWKGAGSLCGGIWGLYFGTAFLSIPDVGPWFASAPLIGCIVGVLAGAAVSSRLSVVGVELRSLGIPNASVLECEAAIRAGKFLVIHRRVEPADRAPAVLHQVQPEAFGEPPTQCRQDQVVQ